MRFLSAAVLLLFAATPALAQDALFASEVNVDVTGTSPTDAREMAFKKAGKDGLIGLLDRVAPDQREHILQQLDDQKVQSMVKGTEVVSEKIVGNRYRATMRVSYDALALSGLVEKKSDDDGIEDSTQRSTAMMIIPVFEENGSLRLFDDTNPWWKAWRKVALEKRGGNIIVPYGDTPDMSAIDAAGAVRGKFADFARLINRYGVRELVVLKATYTETPEKRIDVIKRNVSRTQDEAITLDYRADATEDQDDMLQRAARDITDQIVHQREEELKRQAMLGVAAGRMMIVVPMTTLASWTEVRNKLNRVTAIERIEMLAISPVQVDGLVHFRGSPEGLMKSIDVQGLRVTPAENYWVVTRD